MLALHGLNVRSAVVAGEDGVAVEIFTVEPRPGPVAGGGQAVRTTWPRSWTARLAVDEPAGRAGPHLPQRRPGPAWPSWSRPRSRVDNNASATATVVEVRAEDVVGQLHRITRALVDCHLDVTSAKVSTFGSAVVDAFYVRGPDGRKLTDAAPDRRRRGRPSAAGWPSRAGGAD